MELETMRTSARTICRHTSICAFPASVPLPASESEVSVPPVAISTKSFIWCSMNSVNGFTPRDSEAKFTSESCGITPLRPSNTAAAAST